MKFLKQIFGQYEHNGKCDPSLLHQMISKFYTAKTGKPCTESVVKDLLEKHKLLPPQKLEFIDFCFFASNFGMMLANQEKNEKDYDDFFLLFTFGSMDPKGTGNAFVYGVIDQLSKYFGQMNPAVTIDIVQQIVLEEGVQIGAQIDFDNFCILFRKSFEKLKVKYPPVQRAPGAA